MDLVKPRKIENILNYKRNFPIPGEIFKRKRHLEPSNRYD